MTLKVGDRVKFVSHSGKTWTYGDIVEMTENYPIVELKNGIQIGCNPKDLVKVVRRQ